MAETIAEVGLFLKQEPYGNIETQTIYDFRVGRELQTRVLDAQQ